jgi:hypothetical protein
MNLRSQPPLLFFAFILSFSAHVSAAVRPATQPANMPWGETANGLRGSFAIFGRVGDDYHPGEPIKMLAAVQNVSDQTLRVPHITIPSFYAQLHVRLPDSRELVTTDRRMNLSFDDPRNENLVMKLAPQAMGSSAGSQLRTGDQVEPWTETATGKTISDLSFRAAGKYEFWFVYTLPASKVGNWSGSLSSNHAVITVSELPVKKRLAEPTSDQLALLQKFLASKKQEGLDQLMTAMDATENEGLALRIVDLIKTSPDNPRAILVMLIQERYGFFYNHNNQVGGVGAGIDGPYLERFTQFNLDRLEGHGPPLSRFGGDWDSYADVRAVLVYLHFHPEPSATRDRAVNLAKQSLHGKGLPSMPRSTGWMILVYANVLRDDLSLQDATAILGAPQSQTETSVEWWEALAAGHPVPGTIRLTATLKDGILSHFHAEKVSRTPQ